MRTLLALVMMFTLTACSIPGTGEPAPPLTPPDSESLILSTRTHLTYGVIVTDNEGHSLYMNVDDANEISVCECGGFARLMSRDSVTTQGGLRDELLGVNGEGQVMYADRLLYTYSGDLTPGDTNGQNRDNKWFLIDNTGKQVVR